MSKSPQELSDESNRDLRRNLDSALQELEETGQEAEENGWPAPSSSAIRSARYLLPELCRLCPRGFSVYPLFDGEIAIETTTASGDSIVVSCEADGSVLFLVNIHRRGRRAKYADASDLPDAFAREAFREMEEAERQAYTPRPRFARLRPGAKSCRCEEES